MIVQKQRMHPVLNVRAFMAIGIGQHKTAGCQGGNVLSDICGKTRVVFCSGNEQKPAGLALGKLALFRDTENLFGQFVLPENLPAKFTRGCLDHQRKFDRFLARSLDRNKTTFLAFHA